MAAAETGTAALQVLHQRMRLLLMKAPLLLLAVVRRSAARGCVSWVRVRFLCGLRLPMLGLLTVQGDSPQ